MAQSTSLENEYDLIVIGGGSAGLTAATIAGRLCAKVLLVDREALGGDCLHHGCVPSKALLRTAKVTHTVRNASKFGVDVGAPTVDFGRVMGFVRAAIETVGHHDSPEKMKALGVEVAFGGAELLGGGRVRIGGAREVGAKAVIVAVGSRAEAPPIEGLSEVGFIDHVSLFDLKELPPRLVVIGGGPVGVEVGQAMARLGSTVTLLQSGPRLLMRDDPSLAALLGQYLAEEMTILYSANVIEVRRGARGKEVVFESDGRRDAVVCDEILVAVGRSPELSGLGLAAAGVATTEKGIVVDEALATTARGIWACGDCVGSYQFTHFAEAQARVATRNALFRGKQKLGDVPVPWVTFTDPELAHVGLTEDAAREKVSGVEIFNFPYERLDRAVCEGEARGLAKVVCDRSGRILGASILGPHAGEAINELSLAMTAGLTLSKITAAIHAYPTMGRVVRRLGDERFLAHGVSELTAKLFGKYRRECAT